MDDVVDRIDPGTGKVVARIPVSGRLFGACDVDSVCRTAYPTLEQSLKDAVARLRREPVVVRTTGDPEALLPQIAAVTPDPGVIEVNVHPAANWREGFGCRATSTRCLACGR